MPFQILELCCPNCGGSINKNLNVCNYCGRELIITSFTSIYNIVPNEVNKYIRFYKRVLDEHPDDPLINYSIAMCYLKLKLFDQALPYFEKAIRDNFDNPESYFYAAVCQLRGKKAFLTPMSYIRKAMDYINAAKLIENRGIYDYFLAYIKYDFFERKSLNIKPNFQEELEQAGRNNVTQDDIHLLFELLNVSKPEAFN